jgi:hypothetical protein
MKPGKITWAKFIEIVQSGVIFRGEHGVYDASWGDEEGDEDNSDSIQWNYFVNFRFEIDGDECLVRLYEEDNHILEEHFEAANAGNKDGIVFLSNATGYPPGVIHSALEDIFGTKINNEQKDEKTACTMQDK